MAPIQIIVRDYDKIMKLMQLALTAAKYGHGAGPYFNKRKTNANLAACVKIMSIEKPLISRRYEWAIAEAKGVSSWLGHCSPGNVWVLPRLECLSDVLAN